MKKLIQKLICCFEVHYYEKYYSDIIGMNVSRCKRCGKTFIPLSTKIAKEAIDKLKRLNN